MNQSIFSPNSCLHSTVRQTAADKGSVIKRLLAQILLTLSCKSPPALAITALLSGAGNSIQPGWEPREGAGTAPCLLQGWGGPRGHGWLFAALLMGEANKM